MSTVALFLASEAFHYKQELWSLKAILSCKSSESSCVKQNNTLSKQNNVLNRQNNMSKQEDKLSSSKTTDAERADTQ